MTVELRQSDWSRTTRTTDNAIASIIEPGKDYARHRITALSASYDDLTQTGDLYLFGLEEVNGAKGYVGPFDCTDTDVVDLTANTITVSGHGLTNGDKVVFHTGSGSSTTAPTNLTSGTMYYVVGVSGSDFQLALTSGGAAIDLAGTQANLATAAYVLKLGHQWGMLGEKNLAFPNPLVCGVDVPVVAQLSAVASTQGLLNMSGFTKA